MARRSSGDVHWHVPHKTRPIAYSSKATSDLIAMLAAEALTFEQARTHIHHDDEALAVLDAYIERGFGDIVMSSIGVR